MNVHFVKEGLHFASMDSNITVLALSHILEHISRISKKDIKKQKLQLYIDVKERDVLLDSICLGVEKTGSRLVPFN